MYSEGVPWVKKGDGNFDIGMGAYHGAQACEIVGLFLLSLLDDLPNFRTILYRDDGLGITTSSPRLQEKLMQPLSIRQNWKDAGTVTNSPTTQDQLNKPNQEGIGPGKSPGLTLHTV